MYCTVVCRGHRLMLATQRLRVSIYKTQPQFSKKAIVLFWGLSFDGHFKHVVYFSLSFLFYSSWFHHVRHKERLKKKFIPIVLPSASNQKNPSEQCEKSVQNNGRQKQCFYAISIRCDRCKFFGVLACQQAFRVVRDRQKKELLLLVFHEHCQILLSHPWIKR